MSCKCIPDDSEESASSADASVSVIFVLSTVDFFFEPALAAGDGRFDIRKLLGVTDFF